MEDITPSYPTNPFSQPGYTGFIFDLYMEGSLPDFFVSEIKFHPTGAEQRVATIQNIPVQNNRHWMVGDIPGYLKTGLSPSTNAWHIKRVPQYKGYGIDLSGDKNVESFLSREFSKKGIQKLRAKVRKLESSREITYSFYFGGISRAEYEAIFTSFYEMLERRFDEIRMYNRNLIHWPYFFRNTFQKILDKEAFLFVIRDGKTPVFISLDYVFGNAVFGFIQSFDASYHPFNPGDVSMLKKLEWCLARGIAFFDLSKGENFFKEKWSNHPYVFDYYLFYRKKDPGARIWATLTASKLRLRQFLRDKGILGKWFQFDKFFYEKQRRKLQGFDWHKEVGL
jgi:CelD/BcsL family acetyltransferase involved in cellulose biosynthesis